MRKNFGAKPYVYPQPVFIIGSYDEHNVPDAMNTAWGSIADYEMLALYVNPNHKTVKNILARRAFSVSMASEEYLVACDYVGIVSANTVTNKFAHSGFHAIKSEFVDAPMIEELPLTLECQMIRYDEQSNLLLGKIVNVSADESILDEKGSIDPSKLHAITFDPVHNAYLKLGDKVGNAFKDGNNLK